MFSHFQQTVQNPILDALYCEEERFDENVDGGFGWRGQGIEDFDETGKKPPFCLVSEHDLVWEDEELCTLLDKEKEEGRGLVRGRDEMARNEAIKWMLRVIGFYGFNAMTALLAVNYYDRFIGSVCLQQDRPWMSQLAAVACLSIAAKVEETRVPLLLDLQVEESKFLFEAKTIQRMELLILSTLEWKVNLVTPISFIDHIVRRFELMSNLHWDFLSKCENVVLSIVTDCRLSHYLPSVVAAAIMVHVISEIQACDAPEYKIRFVSILKANKEKIDECHKLVAEGMNELNCKKRKHKYVPRSPSGVIDAYLSSDSSVDSWAVAPSMSSSLPKTFFKRSRARDQHMRLGPRSSVSIGMSSRRSSLN